MIGFEKRLVSKVLIFEENPSAQIALKEFCATSGLVGVKQTSDSSMKMLYTNSDLGAILLSEKSHDSAEGLTNGFELAQRIKRVRKELPIFMRLEDGTVFGDIPEEQQKCITGTYTLEDMSKLTALVDQYLADTEYPISLIRRIEEVTTSALASLFHDIEVTMDLPYLVKDKLVWGDILSLLPVESPWFVGYMMVQSEEVPMISLIEDGRTSIPPENIDFRDVMGMLSEISNQAWGGLRTRLISLFPPDHERTVKIFVPITVNQYKEYISFGTDRSQLCFKYTLKDKLGKLMPVTLYQKFVFNIRWNPEEYQEADENTVEELVESGCLEMF